MVFLHLVLWALVAQQPPRDTKPSPRPATGTIAGRVVDSETGAPIAGAIVSVTVMRSTERPPQVEADDRGGFRLSGLAAGDYRIDASPAEHKPTHIYAVFNLDPLTSSPLKPSLHLAAGEVRDDIVIRLERALAVEGRVLDESGEPMADARVSLERLSTAGSGGGSEQLTDDRGAFRLYGFSAGSYRVCVAPPHSPVDRLLMPGSRGDAVEQPYVRTCGESVQLRPGGTPHATLVMRRVTGYAVSGRAVSESGRKRLNVMLERLDEDATSAVHADVKDGQFIVRGVPPGEYAVRASAMPEPQGPNEMVETERATARIRVDSADVPGIDLVTTRGATIAGRVVAEIPLPPSIRPSVVRAQAYSRQLASGPNMPTRTRDDLTFELRELHDPVLLDVTGLPAGWVMTAIRYKGTVITDTPTTLATGSDPSELEIVVSPRAANLRVRPVDAEGRTVDVARVMIIRAAGPRMPIMARVNVSPTVDGALQFPALPPGEYFILATRPVDLMPRGSEQAALLRQLGKRIVVQAGPQTMDVVVVAVPEVR